MGNNNGLPDDQREALVQNGCILHTYKDPVCCCPAEGWGGRKIQ